MSWTVFGEIDLQHHRFKQSVESQKLMQKKTNKQKNREATLLFVDFSKANDSLHRGKLEQILLAYGIPKETVTAAMILHRNTKIKVRSQDFFDMVSGVLQGDRLALYLIIICLDDILRTSIDLIKENIFTLKKAGSRRYSADYAMTV